MTATCIPCVTCLLHYSYHVRHKQHMHAMRCIPCVTCHIYRSLLQKRPIKKDYILQKRPHVYHVWHDCFIIHITCGINSICMRLRDITNACGPCTCVTWLIDSNLWRECLDATKYVTWVTWLFIVGFIVGDVCSDDSFNTMCDTTYLLICEIWVTWHLTIGDMCSDYLFMCMSDMRDMDDIGAYTWQCVQWWLTRSYVWYGCVQLVICVVVTHSLICVT